MPETSFMPHWIVGTGIRRDAKQVRNDLASVSVESQLSQVAEQSEEERKCPAVSLFDTIGKWAASSACPAALSPRISLVPQASIQHHLACF
jgi:hypothetical protein